MAAVDRTPRNCSTYSRSTPDNSGRSEMRTYLYALPALIIAAPLAAQSEGELRSYFEGKTVVVKLDLPATDDGVDVYPTRAQPVDFSKYAKRIKKHGTAVKSGESIVVTKVKGKEDL